MCVNIENDKVPEIYLCDKCGNLKYDTEAARRYQDQRLRTLKDQGTLSTDAEDDELALRSKRIKGNADRKRNSTDATDQPVEYLETTEDGLKRRKSKDDDKERRTGTSERGSSAGASPTVSSRSSPVPSTNGSANSVQTPGTATPGSRRGRGKRLTVANGLPLAPKDDVNDNDAEPEKKFTLDEMYNSYYVPIPQNRYSTPDVHEYVNGLASCTGPESEYLTHFTTQDYDSIKHPEVSVRLTSDHPKQKFSGFSRLGLYIERTVSRDRFIINYVGQVMTKVQYKSNPINQYRQFGCPKPGVLFHSFLPICIDARLVGSQARFMRRSCTPNCKVSTVVVDDKHVIFAAFSTEVIKAGAELTVAWEWDEQHPVRKLLDDIPAEQLSKEERVFLAQVASMANQRGADCACNLASSECLLARMKRANGTPPRNTRIGSKTRRGISESNTPNGVDSGVEGDSTPLQFGTEAVDNASFYSSREARKLQSAMELIERLSRNNGKKRKFDEEAANDSKDTTLHENSDRKPVKLGPKLVDKAVQTPPIVVPLRSISKDRSTDFRASSALPQHKRMFRQYLQAKQLYSETHIRPKELLIPSDSLPLLSQSAKMPLTVSTRLPVKPTVPLVNGSNPTATTSTTPNVSLPSSPHLPHNDTYTVTRIPSKPPTPVPVSPITTPITTPTFESLSQPSPAVPTPTTTIPPIVTVPDAAKPPPSSPAVASPVIPITSAASAPVPVAVVAAAVPATPVVAKTVKKLSFADYKKKKTSTVVVTTTSTK